jgi:cyanate permease
VLFLGLPEQAEDTELPNEEISCQRSGSLGHAHKIRISPHMVWQTLTDVKRIPHFVATGLVFSTWSPLTTYTPSILMELGFARLEANVLAAVGSLLTLPVILFFAWISDRSNRRGLTVMIAISIYLITLVILRIFQTHVGKWGKFGLWTAVNAFAVGYHPIHNAWIQINCKTSEERSINVA